MEIARAIIAKNLVSLRKGKGWTQEDLAHESGFSRGYIADIERQVAWVSPEGIEAFAKALDVDIGKLFTTEAHKQQVMPMSRIAKRIAAIPDEVYEQAERLVDNEEDLWDVITGMLKIRADEKEAKRRLASQS